MEVDQGPSQVRVHIVDRAEVSEPPRDPGERLLHEVLRLRSVAREEVGEPEGARRVPHVRLLEAIRRPLAGTFHDL